MVRAVTAHGRGVGGAHLGGDFVFNAEATETGANGQDAGAGRRIGGLAKDQPAGAVLDDGMPRAHGSGANHETVENAAPTAGGRQDVWRRQAVDERDDLSVCVEKRRDRRGGGDDAQAGGIARGDFGRVERPGGAKADERDGPDGVTVFWRRNQGERRVKVDAGIQSGSSLTRVLATGWVGGT